MPAIIDDEAEKALWVKCLKCCHTWVVAYLPMEVHLVARAAGRATCPACGNGPKEVVIANKEDIETARSNQENPNRK